MRDMKSLRRGLDILGLFAERPRQDFAELAAATKLPRSSLYRFLAALEERGFVRHDPATGEYAPGVLLYRLGGANAWLHELRQAARAAMPALARQIGESVYLYARDGANRVCVEAAESGNGPIKHAMQPGSVFPLHAGASGKAILAFLPDAERARLVRTRVLRRFAPGTITRAEPLEAGLGRIRRAGWAWSEEEVSPGAWALAVPIRDAPGACVGSLGVAGPLFRLRRDRVRDWARLLQAASARLTKLI